MKFTFLVVGALTFLMMTPTPVSASTAIATLDSVTAVAEAGVNTTQIHVPAGLTPTTFHGRLTLDSPHRGTVTVLVGGRVLAKVPASSNSIATALKASDVHSSVLEIGLRYDVPDDSEFCHATDVEQVSLDHLSIDYDGAAATPKTVADFFDQPVSEVAISLPDHADRTTLEAGLVTVAALSHRFGQTTDVHFGQPAKNDATVRVVKLRPDSGRVKVTLDASAGLPTLVVSGATAKLPAGTKAFGSANMSLGNAASVTELEQTSERSTPTLKRTIASLGTSEIALSGFGTSESYTGVSQDAFGGPVSSYVLRLKGINSVVPGLDLATMGVYWNGYLLKSVELGASRNFDDKITIPSSQVKSSNALVVRLRAVARDGKCVGGSKAIPVELFVDTKASSLTATRGGHTASGLSSFPQVLGGSLPVAFEGPTDATAAANAGSVVQSLQRVADSQLDVHVVSSDDLIKGSRSGLLVGARSEQSDQLKAPLRLGGFRLVSYAEGTFGLGTNHPYAALEAVDDGARTVLMLGGWMPGGGTSPELQTKVAQYVHTKGWSTLSDDLVIGNEDKPAFNLDSNSVVPQKAVTDSYRHLVLWLVAFVVLLALILGARSIVATRRRRKISRYVDAQETADASSGDSE